MSRGFSDRVIGTLFAAGRVFVSTDDSDSNMSGKKANRE